MSINLSTLPPDTAFSAGLVCMDFSVLALCCVLTFHDASSFWILSLFDFTACRVLLILTTHSLGPAYLPCLSSRCQCVYPSPSLCRHMVKSCMSEQQTARQHQSAPAASCASPRHPLMRRQTMLALLNVLCSASLPQLPYHDAFFCAVSPPSRLRRSWLPVCSDARLTSAYREGTAAAQCCSTDNRVSDLSST